jgi:hypothetical protein
VVPQGFFQPPLLCGIFFKLQSELYSFFFQDFNSVKELGMKVACCLFPMPQEPGLRNMSLAPDQWASDSLQGCLGVQPTGSELGKWGAAPQGQRGQSRPAGDPEPL